MNKCHHCHKSDSPNWIAENHYLGSKGQILKEVNIGTISEEPSKPFQTVYYCSLNCLERQMDQEDKKLWAKGNCPNCQKPLAVINEPCSDPNHQKEACLYPI